MRLAYRATADLIIISTDEDLCSEMFTVVYDIRDLSLAIPRFGGRQQLDPASTVAGAGGGGGLLPRGADDDEGMPDMTAENGAMLLGIVSPRGGGGVVAAPGPSGITHITRAPPQSG